MAAVGFLLAGIAALLVLLTAIRGLPLLAEALQGRRIEEAVRSRDGAKLQRSIGGAYGFAELRRILRRLSTAELLALGEVIAPAAGEERGNQALAAIGEVVEHRQAVVSLWERLERQRPTSPPFARSATSPASPTGETEVAAR
jgi:hypothetical protein